MTGPIGPAHVPRTLMHDDPNCPKIARSHNAVSIYYAFQTVNELCTRVLRLLERRSRIEIEIHHVTFESIYRTRADISSSVFF
jgi:hypothetical protein